MRDMFDDFMKELKRRQDAAAAGLDPRASGPSRDKPARPDDHDADAHDADDHDADAHDEHVHDTGAHDGEVHDEDDAADPVPDAGDAGHEPTPFGRPGSSRRSGGRGPGRGGPAGPRPPGRSGGGGPRDGAPGLGQRLRGVGLIGLAVAVFLVIALAGAGLDLWTDAIWFRSVHFDAVFWTRIGTQAVLLGSVFVGVLLFLGFNLWLAGRLTPPEDPNRVPGSGTMGGFAARLGEALGVDDRNAAWSGGLRPGSGDPRARRGGQGPTGANTFVLQADDLPDLVPIARWALFILAVLIAIGAAAGAASGWETFLLWRNQVPFSPAGIAPVVDPIFGRDVSYYLFELPFLRMGQATINGLFIAALVLSLARYLSAGLRGGLSFTTPMRVHLAVLGGLYLLTVAAGYQLDKLELAYSSQGIAIGVSYTDQHARFLAFDVLTAISAFAGAFLVIGSFTRMMWPLGSVVVVWLAASLVLGTVYPAIVQRVQVLPDQLGKETPYIANAIRMTRIAFNMSPGAWQISDYNGEAPLSPSAVQTETSTFQNARLWDYRPLRDTLDQLQTVRQYYDFTDVDTDRYQLNGALRQVMLAGRELAPENNPQGGAWVNQRITFTHGFGVAMVPVNEATEGGQPKLIIRDLPPVSSDGAPTISQPRIYFGERASDWIITGARQPEFDYPVRQSDAAGAPAADQTTSWTGTTGIKLDTTLSRLLFALRFKDLNLMISDQVTAGSQLLFHRSLSDRLALVAPFLKYDKDPYLVVTADGRLVYVQDAYTTSDRFPNAQWFDPSSLTRGTGLGDQPINYIRNSVKIVMDAYTGQMTFYVVDPNDPIIRTYERIFPTLFTAADQMPPDLRAHLRVPEELFNVQTRMYARYHVNDPATFFSNNDSWTVPDPTGGTQSLPNEAYYVVMRMPGEPKPEFLLLQPMVPKGRPNMIAWIAARMDAPNYGAVRVYRFPQDTSVLGPNQIEAKIDADPIISAQTTLWDQSGSRVIRGNLIVVPVQDALIYLQPVYLQSQNSKFPEFQRIIIATSQRIVWGKTLSEALGLLLAGSPGQSPSPGPSPTLTPGPAGSPTPGPVVGPGQTPPAGDVAALVAYANDHFERAQTALRNGDFATYGTEIAKVQDALRQLNALVRASPGASAAPTP